MTPDKTKRLATMFSVILINSPRPNLGAKAGPGRCDLQMYILQEATSRDLHSGRVVGDAGISRC
jgi:hypothetical protein